MSDDEDVVIGAVVARTVCDDCAGNIPDKNITAVIRDGPAYGAEVPYPECNECGEVMRPDEENNE